MNSTEKIYRYLQKHLNQQAIGYPATRSGVELRLLKRFFNPEEACLALHLNYKPRSIDRIFKTAKEMGITIKVMEQMLDSMLQNGVIGHIEKEGDRYFHTLPLAVGMYEGQVNKLTPEFLKDYDEYINGTAFGLEFLSTEIPQMRTIPVRESIPLNHYVTNYDHITDIINNTDGPIAVLECICRQRRRLQGNPCQQTDLMETCISLGDSAKNLARFGIGREISKEEALEICRQSESDGLVLQPSNSQKVEFVCACCGCCCGILSTYKMLPKPIDFWASNYYAEVNPENCTACGTCEERCQVNAINIETRANFSKVNLNRCIGCGNCITSCPSQAISLRKKEKETIPPADSESLYDTIKANRKGTLGKLKLAVRLAPTVLKR